MCSQDFVIENLMSLDFVGIILNILRNNKQNKDMLIEAAWCLSNITASEDIKYTTNVVEKGGIEVVIGVIQHINKQTTIDEERENKGKKDNIEIESKNAKLMEYCIYALGNIAVDEQKFRYNIIMKGGLNLLFQLFQKINIKNLDLMLTSTWVFSILVNDVDLPWNVKSICLYLCKQLLTIDNTEIINSTLWTVIYLFQNLQHSDKNLVEFTEFKKTGISESIISLLNSDTNTKILLNGLYCIKLLTRLDKIFLKFIVEIGVLKKIKNILDSQICNNHPALQRKIIIECLCCLANICTESKYFIQQVCILNICPLVLELTYNSTFELKNEALLFLIL
eukprot:UN07022